MAGEGARPTQAQAADSFDYEPHRAEHEDFACFSMHMGRNAASAPGPSLDKVERLEELRNPEI